MTPEFRRAHRKQITPSDIPACIARRGTKKYNTLIDRLVIDYEGIEQHTDDHPDPWTEKHELAIIEACRDYGLLTGTDVERTGFVVHDTITWFGAAPHGLLPDRCIHIRERSSVRSFHEKKDRLTNPEKAKLHALMFVCGRPAVDVVDFWSAAGIAPNKIARHKLDYDHAWFSSHVLSRIVFVWQDVNIRLRDRRSA